MKFQKVPNEFRMFSDQGNYDLFLLSTGPEANRHFRLMSPIMQLDFDATLTLEPAHDWQVHRIIIYSKTNKTESASEIQELDDRTIRKLIEQALSDFGYFYGNEAGQFGVSFFTDQIHRSH